MFPAVIPVQGGSKKEPGWVLVEEVWHSLQLNPESMEDFPPEKKVNTTDVSPSPIVVANEDHSTVSLDISKSAMKPHEI